MKCSKKKICPICEKRYQGGRNICRECDKKIIEISKRANSKYKISISRINTLRNFYKPKDILEYLLNNPMLIYKEINTSEAKAWLRYRRFQLKEKSKNNNYQDIPLYVKHFFEKHKDLGFINICGNKQDPFITFICKKCHEEYLMHFSNIKTGSTHKCDANLSSGEFLVKDYLEKNKYKYKTQFNTVSCKNPKTGRLLPYDFELTEQRILIEVQGNQHTEYTPYFHGCLENFQYQVHKDKIKKEFATKNGYKLVYLYYSDFKDDSYKNIIEKAIKNY